MRIIVTGGTGLIGKALCRELASDHHEIIVLSRNPSKVTDMPSEVRLEAWDGKSTEGWGQWVDGADAVVNLAGAGIADKRWSDQRKQEIQESRVNAGKALVQAIESAQIKPKVLMQASAVGYYGPQQDDIITEEHGPGNDFLAQVCTDWENSTADVEKHGIRRPILRTGIVLSNEGGAWPKIKLPFTLMAGGPVGSGKQWYPWIHIEDEIRAILFVLSNENATGPFNLSAPNPLTNKALAKVIGKIMGRPAFMPTPGFALQIALGEMSTILLTGQRAVPQNLERLGFSFNYPQAEEAIGELVE